MPIIYLSPSTQENNLYVNGGSEEFWMNRLADEMEPYLQANGIQYVRNRPDMTAVSSIAASNQGDYDLHLALHSNAAPEGLYGQVRGVLVFYFPGSESGKRVSTLLADNLKSVYPIPDKVRIEPTTFIGEVRRVRAVSTFLELGYHDNPDDATWVKQNLNPIAQNIVLSLCQYFGLPYLQPQTPQSGVVDVNWGGLNLRSRPEKTAPIVAQAYDGAPLVIRNRWENWYLVEFDDRVGWASTDYVTRI